MGKRERELDPRGWTFDTGWKRRGDSISYVNPHSNNLPVIGPKRGVRKGGEVDVEAHSIPTNPKAKPNDKARGKRVTFRLDSEVDVEAHSVNPDSH